MRIIGRNLQVETMIDEINYFPRRDNYQKKKKTDEGWGDLKKLKTRQDSKKKDSPTPAPPPPENKK